MVYQPPVGDILLIFLLRRNGGNDEQYQHGLIRKMWRYGKGCCSFENVKLDTYL